MPIEPTFSALISLDYGDSSGSGFKLNIENKTYLVTAKHVLYNNEDRLRCNSIIMTSQKVRGSKGDAQIFEVDMKTAQVYSSSAEDFAIILLEINALPADYVTILQKGNLEVHSVGIDNIKSIHDVDVASDVLLVGFPTSLIMNEIKYFEKSSPLLRKGIVAGFNQDENTFIIDSPSYYGNSGGPVILTGPHGFYLIGLVSKYIPFTITWKNNREASIVHTDFFNSGYTVCVPINSILQFIERTII